MSFQPGDRVRIREGHYAWPGALGTVGGMTAPAEWKGATPHSQVMRVNGREWIQFWVVFDERQADPDEDDLRPCIGASMVDEKFLERLS